MLLADLADLADVAGGVGAASVPAGRRLGIFRYQSAQAMAGDDVG
jgi:hypothetical protein